MPKGRMVRRDDKTSELLSITASKKVDQEMLNALTGDDGPLQSGALPAVKTASQQGAIALHTALDDDKNTVSKPPKRKREKGEDAEKVEPKTLLQSGPQMDLKNVWAGSLKDFIGYPKNWDFWVGLKAGACKNMLFHTSPSLSKEAHSSLPMVFLCSPQHRCKGFVSVHDFLRLNLIPIPDMQGVRLSISHDIGR